MENGSHLGNGSLSIRNKHDIASVKDVFMSTHYWRAFEHLSAPPKLIVDLGAHCGHFSVLCHLATIERFGGDSAEYILVEALPFLIAQIHRVVEEVGISGQVKIVQGLVGKKEGTASFHADQKNLLASHVQSPTLGGNMPVMDYYNLDSIVQPGTPIDILKVDIEGSEYDLLRNFRHLFLSSKLLLVEVHGAEKDQFDFERELSPEGFFPLSPTIQKGGERLLCYGRQKASADIDG
jgi:FkbM family methyltransferase